MGKELQEYYEARFDLFASKGWKDLIEDVQNMKDATDKVSSVRDEKDLYFKKGEVSIMNWVLSLEQMTKDAFEGLKDA